MLSRTKQKVALRKAADRIAKRASKKLERQIREAARKAFAAAPVEVPPPEKPLKTARERKEHARKGERWAVRGPIARIPTGPNQTVAVTANRKARRTSQAQLRKAAALSRQAQRYAAKSRARAAKRGHDEETEGMRGA